jgi:Zn-dependent protease
VFLLEPNPTPYDLRWRMFGIAVRVHPAFWLVSALLGWNVTQLGMGYLLIWVACVFVSILIHELGHVLMGRLFGSWGYIVLYSFGGLAIGSSDLARRWQRVAVSFAGPLAQFLLLGVVIALGLRMVPGEGFWFTSPGAWGKSNTAAFLGMLFEINLFWAILNLLPIWPLDGGKIAREVLEGATPEKGRLYSLGLSAGVSGLLAVHAFLAEAGTPLIPYLPPLGTFMGIFFALFCVSSIQALQEERRGPRWRDDDYRW